MLNEKQFEAVNTVKGPLVIIAGPGTGKTKTLVERVVNILINQNTSPNKIILTTFTNKAARELELRINERLEEMGVNIDLSDMYIGTMHSIWLRLIEENIKYSNFFDNFELMTSDYEQHFFIYSNLKAYKKLDNYREFFDNISYRGDWEISGFIRKKINDLNENCIDIKEISSSDKYINFIKDAYILYEEQLFKENKIDFSYLQIEFLNMLQKNKEFLIEMNEKIDFLMIDEYQDSNRVQEKILLLISNIKKNICVVGDEDQSIYRFRGATAENILNFSKHFDNECKLIILDKNYRSLADIVDFNNKWINYIDWKGHKFEKNIISVRTEGILNSNVLHIAGNNSDENIRNTVSFIKKLKNSGKIDNYNQIAILFSSFKDSNAKKLESMLNKEGIEVYSPRTKVFFEMYEIKLTLGIILACFKKYITVQGTYLEDCLSLARYYAKKDKNILEWIKAKIEFLEDMEYESLNNIFYELFQFEYYKNIFDDTTPSVSRARHNLSVLSKILKDFQKYVGYKKISSQADHVVVKYFFEKYIPILKKARIEDISSEEDYPDNCIVFLTIHQAKGLEFPAVIVYSLYSKPQIHNTSDRLTSIDRLLNSATELSEIDKEYFDFYRKFYVAFSRAKNLLVLSSDIKTLSDNFKAFFYSIPSVNSISFNMEELKLDRLTEKKENKIFAFTSDIALYKFCPQKYKFMREDNFQSFEKMALNIGTIAHKAIEHINRRLKQDKEKKFSLEYIEKLIEKIYRIRKLSPDENFNNLVYLVFSYIEKERTNFKYIYKVEASEYRIEEDYMLYGKIDLILDRNKVLEVIDFKTGRYLNEIDYNLIYNQQLSFYKLLLKKKYPDRQIKTFLYYLEEEDAKKELIIEDRDLEKNYQEVKKIGSAILEKKFFKREYSFETCGNCEFKYYCYGELI
ncbi:MAG: ATP-dependent DNA helicase [Fusobacterium sp.]|uniref:ATP-dependent helicase n=1 Tax=Fusobacterium sp. TaxID=68766 RepID=UPI0026DCD365|nr:ATP-dependent DNA helicase [Fusobacterium sp.]MDO4691045.1 ATP-dependent DNA helicase [Fusobacterium sp.]